MALFTINIEQENSFVSITEVNDCGDVTGINNLNIYYTGGLINGNILYTDIALTIPFVGNNLTYRANAQVSPGNVDLTITPISLNIFDVDNNGLISNSLEC